MKLSILFLLTIGAGLVSAVPIPMYSVVVSSIKESINIRFGSDSAQRPIAHLVRPQSSGNQPGPCRSRFHENALEISNSFRKTIGLSLIEIHKIEDGHFESILAPVSPLHHHRHDMRRGSGADSSFLNRLTLALAALEPWDVAAVSFVLGCGIGVLLRMLWVLAIITHRMLKGSHCDSHECTHVLPAGNSAEAILVFPNFHAYVDENFKIDEADVKPAEPTATPTTSMAQSPSLPFARDIVTSDFIHEAANTFDDFALLRTDGGDLNFERDFPEWFNPEVTDAGDTLDDGFTLDEMK